jgi:glutamine synthetase
MAEYVWIDGTGINLRSKSRSLSHKVNSLADIPEWNYDGSSTYQASTFNSEVLLVPIAYFYDPFREGNNILVMCETYIWADENFVERKPSNTNFRHFASKIME